MHHQNKYTAVVTVVGKDQPGIIAQVTTIIAESNINIINISQTIIEDLFHMVMLVNTDESTISFQELGEILENKGEEISCKITLQRREIFTAMHRI